MTLIQFRLPKTRLKSVGLLRSSSRPAAIGSLCHCLQPCIHQVHVRITYAYIVHAFYLAAGHEQPWPLRRFRVRVCSHCKARSSDDMYRHALDTFEEFGVFSH